MFLGSELVCFSVSVSVLVFSCLLLCLGVNRLSDNLEEMTKKRPSIFFRLCWQIIAPFLITVSQQSVVPCHSGVRPTFNVILFWGWGGGRLSSFFPLSSSNQLAMKATSSLPGLKGLAGSLHWPPSFGFRWQPFTLCGCCLAPLCR